MSKNPTATKLPRMFDLTSDLIDLMAAIQDDDESVRESALAGLEITTENYRAKVGAYIAVADHLEHLQQCAEAEAKLLADRAAALKRRAASREAARKRLLNRVMDSYDALGLQKVETDVGTLTKVRNAPRIDVEHDRGVPPAFFKVVPASKSLDRAALKKHIVDTGETFPGVTVTTTYRMQVYR